MLQLRSYGGGVIVSSPNFRTWRNSGREKWRFSVVEVAMSGPYRSFGSALLSIDFRHEPQCAPRPELRRRCRTAGLVAASALDAVRSATTAAFPVFLNHRDFLDFLPGPTAKHFGQQQRRCVRCVRCDCVLCFRRCAGDSFGCRHCVSGRHRPLFPGDGLAGCQVSYVVPFECGD